ncbi:MAG: DASH family cryptochrome [Saprospirales bacterium]|nr:MAG: DASH family cryptochrome [Saprospirales bacterium]
MENKTGILWFRNDLRLHDNEALLDAIQQVDDLYPVYVFDERIIHGETPLGFRKMGVFRSKFLYESVIDLKENLRKRGADLFVYVGKPEEIVFDLVRKSASSWVFCNRERTSEEVAVQDELEQNLWTIGREIRYYRGKMLYYTADLPFPVPHTPDTFSQFRKEVERFVEVRDPLPSPETIQTGNKLDPTEMPNFEDLGYRWSEVEEKVGFPLKGGESEGIERVNHYIWESDLVSTYKETRNQLLGLDYSSRLSAYLSAGCVSPKYVFSELKKYEEEREKNDSTYWLGFELMWRDYFRFIAKKYGDKIFMPGGISGQKPAMVEDRELFDKWKSGRTGVPFVDANMIEINQTGFMSNRGRQNVASFLVNDLKLNWLWGAQYFESLLVDYDPCSNYGNWNYLAGVGTDPRDNRYFKILSQAKRYDPDGEFVKSWIPALTSLSSPEVHWPHAISEEDLQGTELPEIYKKPLRELDIPE